MAIAVRFAPQEMSADTYDEISRRLEATGPNVFDGLIFHVCYRDGDTHGVTDVWESLESFARFGQTLLPILTDLGMNPGEPEMTEVHNIIRG